jgi:prepilin-type N-terminal cleavage/methylation domain-containing protein
MKTNHHARRGFTLVELLVVIAIIATLAGVGAPVIISQQKKGARTEAISNAKQVGMAMFNFDQDYGSYPSTATGTEVSTNNPDSGLTF